MFEFSRLYYYTTAVLLLLLQLPTVVQSLTSGLFWSGDGTLHGYVAIYEGSSTNMAAVDVSLTSLPSAATGYAVSNGSSCSDIGSVLYQRSFSGTEFTESNEFDISAQTNNECPVYIYGSSGVLVCTMTGSALASSITKYPDATMPYNPSGYVIVGQNPGSCSSSTVSQTVYYNMRGLEASSSGGLHIHTGTQGCATSSTVGGHWWTPSTATDPWSTTYTSTNGTGATLGSFTVQYGFNITAAADHAVVVHAANGTRIGCGQLRVNSGSATLYEPYSQYDVCGTCGGSTTDSSICAALGLTAYYNAVNFCPSPLIPTSSSPRGVGTPEGYPCQMPCRTPHYDTDDIDNVDTFFATLTIISFILITYTFASVVLTERKRKKRMVVLLVASSWFLSFPVLVQLMDGGSDTLCEDSITPYSQSDGGTCTFVAVMIGYFALAISFWWFCNIVHLFLRVGVMDAMCGSKKTTKRQSSNQNAYANYWKYYSIVSFGGPLLCIIALLSGDVFGYYGPLPYCFTSDNNEAVTWTFFHGLLMALYAIGVTMLVLSVLKICRALRGVTTTWKQTVQIHYVPLMFISVFSTFLLCVMIFRLTVAVNEDEYKKSAEEWVKCLYANWAPPPTGLGMSDPATNCNAITSMLTGSKPECGCGTHIPDGLPLWAGYLVSFPVAGQGILIFFIFGLNVDHLKDWSTFLGAGCCKETNAGTTGKSTNAVELSAA